MWCRSKVRYWCKDAALVLRALEGDFRSFCVDHAVSKLTLFVCRDAVPLRGGVEGESRDIRQQIIFWSFSFNTFQQRYLDWHIIIKSIFKWQLQSIPRSPYDLDSSSACAPTELRRTNPHSHIWEPHLVALDLSSLRACLILFICTSRESISLILPWQDAFQDYNANALEIVLLFELGNLSKAPVAK